EADVGELLAALAVMDVVQHHDVVGGKVGQTRRRHAAHDPAFECMAGDHQAEFHFGQVGRTAADQVGGRGDDLVGHKRNFREIGAEKILIIYQRFINI